MTLHVSRASGSASGIPDIAHELEAQLRRALRMVDAERFDDELLDCVRHARVLHGVLVALVGEHEDRWIADEAALICGDAEEVLERLEALIATQAPG